MEARAWHSHIRQEPHAVSLQIETDVETTILPYAYLQETRCRRKGPLWELTLYWPWVAVSLQGRNLHKLPDLIAGHRLAALEFRAQEETMTRANLLKIESLRLIPRAPEPLVPPPADPKPLAGATFGHRQAYSIG